MKQRARLACLVSLVFAGMALADQARAPTLPGAVSVPEVQAALVPRAPQVGQHIDASQLHPVRRPGLYGVSGSPVGSRYGVIDGRLIRYDPDTMRVQSIIRPVDEILD